MLTLSKWPLAQRQRIRGVLTDIDDTLTCDGAISSDALHGLQQLKRAGYAVIAITGRPVGWSVPFAQTWPVDAIVAENGAVALLGKRKLYLQDAPTRQHNHARMQAVMQQVLQTVPGAHASQDSDGRETDIAIDHSEFHHLGEDEIAQVVRLMQHAGMNATVSSIHINGWFGSHNKLEGARWIVRELFQRPLDAELDAWAYVGDSTNDQLMFAHFANSIGVANIQRFVPTLAHLPRYVTPSERGTGFREVVQAILNSRRDLKHTDSDN
jgi:HAD superfamily hydrolase (TIGR01484 family)